MWHAFAWIAALHDDFNAARHRAAAIRLFDGFSINVEFSFMRRCSSIRCDRIDYNML